MITTLEDRIGENYPIIKQSTSDNLIVLFTGPDTGVTLTESDLFPKGLYSIVWREDNFIVYNGKIILQND